MITTLARTQETILRSETTIFTPEEANVLIGIHLGATLVLHQLYTTTAVLW